MAKEILISNIPNRTKKVTGMVSEENNVLLNLISVGKESAILNQKRELNMNIEKDEFPLMGVFNRTETVSDLLELSMKVEEPLYIINGEHFSPKKLITLAKEYIIEFIINMIEINSLVDTDENGKKVNVARKLFEQDGWNVILEDIDKISSNKVKKILKNFIKLYGDSYILDAIDSRVEEYLSL